MKNISRRNWLKHVVAGTAALSAGELLLLNNLHAKNSGNIIVIGAGYGGATCARYIKKFSPSSNVTLIEPNTQFISCPFSNLVIAGNKQLDFITHQYTPLKKQSINVVHDLVIKIQKSKNQVTLKSGKSLAYDYLVVSPGIDFNWDKITGYNESNIIDIPHAWQAAGEQTILLGKQIKTMPDGGTLLISIPEKPYRAPPAPYERASLVADYLSKHKPKSKILLLDPNGTSEKLELFKHAWNKYYNGIIEWQGGKDALITKVNAKNKTLISQSGIKYKADVINLIPPQFAASIARKSGLANNAGWCDIDPKTFKSKKAKNIYVIGDSCNAGDMPKLAHAANSQAKSCALAIIASMNGSTISDPVLNTTIYSFISPKSAISEVGVYRVNKGKILQVSGGISKKNASKKHRLKESKFAYGWYKGINRDMLGS
ncbi:Flavocytochrome c:sulfide dehydrogenase [hydrothermal vent metagenome]|uniref:Flavocytochrome c:sulfide dehydrogenase n=1 Tax=hydrothermal vent metagenome TaxID=652676 RepID=A0A3B0ZZ32_9ZZZZ